jgi:hypothetical protein
LPWYRRRLPRPFSEVPPDLELSAAQYSTIESAGQIKLGSSERQQLSALLRRYQLDLLSWTAAPRPREAREILEPLQTGAAELRERLQRLLQGAKPAKEAKKAALHQLLLNAPAPEPTTPRWYGWDYPRNDWQTWLEDTLSRVTLLDSWLQRTTEKLRENGTGGRDSDEFLRGLIRSLREFFLGNHGRDEQRFGRDRRGPFIYFVEAALRCVPDHHETKALAKIIARALNPKPPAGQNPRRRS